jgi:hypothetical protein
MKSVLVFCPVHPARGLEPLTEAALSQLTYPRREVWVSYGDNPWEHESGLTAGRYNILQNYRKARTLFLAGGFDYLMTIESDMTPPGDVIERLMAADADVAYSLYCFRQSHRWNAFKEFHLGWGRSLTTFPDYARSIFGQVVEVPGCGLGATLIRRNVLETLDFRGYHGTSCDGWFALDCQAAGFTQKCDTGCVSGHLDGDAWLWPSIEAETLVSMEPV